MSHFPHGFSGRLPPPLRGHGPLHPRRPRAFSFGDDGRLLWFLRSTGPTDPFDSLWVLDTVTGTETRLADPRDLLPDGPGELPSPSGGCASGSG